ncbi:hypothetical protein B7P43_G06905 [Cryptotermes secundus]|uniref:EF-hand domain-containing protein n=1 Tax=Cryptotermes secundus TaxID=105785 RepID=A0A2J7PN40_9NEOP|nr:hypothetical protein B7P43_G06905 [Cryptotermes secundus]
MTEPVTVAERSKACTVFARWDREFESRSRHRCLMFVYMRAFLCVCVQAETPVNIGYENGQTLELVWTLGIEPQFLGRLARSPMQYLLSYPDSSLYAHYVFKAFDVNSNGAISFRDLLVTLSTLLRGSIYEKLRWTFKLYDINGDGCITRAELAEIVVAIHELMGRRAHQVEDDRKAREQVDRVFKKLDLNQDGVITIEEFIESCLKVGLSII